MKSSVQPAASLAGAPPPPRRSGQTLKVLAAALFLALVLPLILLAGLLAWHQYRILTTWPAVDALVTRAELTTSASHTSQPSLVSYGGRFSFRYTASGRVYESSTDLGYSSPRQSDIERWMMQMPTGSHQRIRYDPSNPAHISLVTDYTPKSFAVPFTLAKWAGIMALVAGALFWLGWRAGEKPGVGSR